MTLSELIRSYRKEKDLSQRQFALQCDLSNGYISFLEKGVNPQTQQPITPTLPALQKLAAGMNITLNDLFKMVDDMPIELRPDTEAVPNLIPLEPMERIPLLGAIACGDPILAQENIEDYIDLPRTIKADFALTCEGDSMIDAGIKDGDVVYIRSQPEVQNGQIAAVLVDGESATLKRFFFNDGVVTLMAANQSYPPIVKAGSDVEQVRVLGLAVGLSRSFFK